MYDLDKKDKKILGLYLMGKDVERIALIMQDTCNIQRRLDYIIESIQKCDNPAERLIQLGVIPEYKISKEGRKLLQEKY